MERDVVIIGAGLSGLCAGKILLEAGVNFIVLEATERVGGRILTRKNSKVGYVDVGGSYVGPTQNRIFRLAREFGIENYRVNERGDLLHYRNGWRVCCSEEEMPRRWNPFVMMDINNAKWLIDKMGKEIPAEAPWNAPKAKEWDATTFKEFLKKKCWTQESIENMLNFCNLNNSAEGCEASLLSILWYIKQCGGWKRINATTNGAQERKFVGGSQQICDSLSSRLESDRVALHSPVVEISQEEKEEVAVKTLNGEVYKTKYVILACPPVVQMKIHFKPPLPPLRNQLMQKMPMGRVTKLILFYETAFWRDEDLCGTFYIEGDDDYPSFMFQDDTKPDGSHPAVVGFFLGNKCNYMQSRERDERRVIAMRSLAEATGLDEFLEPIHYVEKNWTNEQYCGGGYTAVYPPGFFTNYGEVLRAPIDRLYFAGTETATCWSGYMDGAVQAGERAAREVLYSMGKIPEDKIWQEEPKDEDVIAVPFETTFAEMYMPSVSAFLAMVLLVVFLCGALILMIRYSNSPESDSQSWKH